MSGNIGAAFFPIADILREAKGILVRGDKNESVQGVSTDSRTLAQGNLFVALRGATFDGHDFLDQAVAGGAGALLVERDDGNDRVGVPTILVPDTLTALGDLARAWRNRFSVPVLAITGSSGKTSTKEMTAAILSQRRKVLKTEKNYNNLIGLPLTLFRLGQEHEAVVLELGTNRPGEIARLSSIAVPSIAAVTNIGPAHLEGFGSLEGVAQEKGDIFLYLSAGGTAVINHDDPYGRRLPLDSGMRRLTFGFAGDADVSASDIQYIGVSGIRFTLNMMGTSRQVQLAVTGKHNVQNALAAAALAWAAGSTVDDVVQGLAAFKPIAGRMEIVPLRNGAFLINDAYNANPASVREALNVLRDLKGEGRGIAVLGAMLELGNQAESRHREIGGLLADAGVSRAYLRGGLTRATAAGALDHGLSAERIVFCEDARQIVEDMRDWIEAGDWILVKGSRGAKMEEVVNGMIAAVGRTDEDAGSGAGGRP